jgi:hypothetical protein
MARNIRLCCLAHAGIEVASHDPPWNSTVEKSLCGQFEVAFLIRLEVWIESEHLYVRSKVT